jgi:phage protein D
MTLGGLMGSAVPAIVWPTVKVGKVIGIPLLPNVIENLVRAVVDTHLHLPDMFELTFHDEEGTIVADAGLEIGSTVEIFAGAPDSDSTSSLIKGEVTSIEAICQEGLIHSVVRGYEKAHRLQRAKRTKTFLNMKDSEIAAQVAGDAGLDTGVVEETSVAHDHIAQIAQTDWDFLQQRAREIGYETGVVGGKFFFRKASGRKDGGGGLGGMLDAAVDALADMLGLGGKLTFKDNLHTFLPRLSAANLTPDVEVRVWDPKDARVAVAKVDTATGTASIDDQDPAKLAKSFTDGLISLPSLPAMPSIPGMPSLNLGQQASNTAYLVVDRPLGVGPAADTAAEAAAKGVADHIASTFAEAEGDATGDPKIQAGAEVEIDGVPEQFCGKWFVTNARHVFDAHEDGYHTRFWVSGRQNRSLLGLTSGGARAAKETSFGGLVCGIVTNVSDKEKLGRVKVALPWLAPNYESDWARVVQFGAGARTGALFLPSVGDEVLVGFEFGDSRRPYVLGGLLNSKTDYGELKNAVAGSGIVTKRGIASPAGNQLTFTDELPPGPPGSLPPIQSKIQLGTKGDKLGLVIDQVAGTVTLACSPKPPESKSPNGSLTIECGDLGGITIKGGTGGVKIETDGQLSLNGKMGVKIESSAVVEVKGSLIKLN